MKTSNNLTYGKLNETYYPVYAQYFRDFHAITVQNEPRYEPYTYPGMLYEWYNELNFVRGYLFNAMNGTGVNLLTFDHNSNLDWYRKAVMNEGQAYYAGSAWHCYGGNNTAMSGMHDEYPNKGHLLHKVHRHILEHQFRRQHQVRHAKLVHRRGSQLGQDRAALVTRSGSGGQSP